MDRRPTQFYRTPHQTRGAWNSSSVRNVLQNQIYTGVRQRGGVQTNRFEHLQIIEDKLFLMARARLEKSRLETPHIGYTRNRDDVLLPDQLFCMHCGKRMTVTRNMKTRVKKDGSKVTYDRLKYICINKSSFQPCGGQRSYSTGQIDTAVLALLQTVLLSDGDFAATSDTSTAKLQCERLEQEINQERISLEALKAEVLQVLQGTSAFGSVLIRELIQKSESRLIGLEHEIAAVQEELHQSRARWNRVSELRKELISSNVRELRALPFHQQREIAKTLISRIELGRGREIQIQWSYGGTAHLPAFAGG